MTIRKLPQAKVPAKPNNFQWDAPSDVLARWAERPHGAEADEPNTISIYDVIGEDWWTGGGFTAARAAAALRSIGKNDVTVNINSPGGDMFEGIAIYNLLREHPAKVTVNVMGLAASAASIIAMAGDTINMGLGSFLMIHNAWGVVIGNRHDMRDAAGLFDGFDGALADIYEARTTTERAEIVRLMDTETFMGPSQAVELGFADTVDEGLQLKDGPDNSMDKSLMARRQTEAALARAGFSRSDRTQMIAALGGPRDATTTPPPERDAGDIHAGLRGLINTLKN
ncbi:head maturation protease, ClpP-related [Alteriqipengyuania sp.]|uniref:head maturation protease, ClpP-related n=1 Tax=Alteriqipengyuania sp. TaxID=2800692 RepID=UPI003516BEE3